MSSRKITDLAMDTQKLALDFITECRNQGVDVLIYCTWRSPEEQAELYASGRTTPGQIKTNAAPGQSAHNLTINGKCAARAFDAAPIINGRIEWETIGAGKSAWLKMGTIAMAMGLTWGGNWRGKLRDYPHFELK